MRVLYLTWGETPRSYGVFGSQVIGQFVATRRVMPQSQFLFASGIPIINSGMTREKFGYAEECRKIREALGDIAFKLLPIYAPQNLVNSSRKSFRWFHGAAHWHLSRLIKKFNPDVVHCRSYHAAWAALSVRRSNKLYFRIIFDGRGLYPEEVALKKGYDDNNSNYMYLKQIERELLTGCDMTIAVSDPMEQHYRRLGAIKWSTVYLSADAELLKPLPSIGRIPGSVNFCYVGALSEDIWHKTSELVRLFRRIRELVPHAVLTIVTTSDHDAVRKAFTGFSEVDVRIVKSKSLHQLTKYLSEADFGLMSYFEPKTPRELMLAKMLLAVKTAEYLCAGLPIIVNRFCGGAAEIVSRNDMGLIYDPGNLGALHVEDIINRVPDAKRREAIASKARCMFDYSKHAHSYAGIYENLFRSKSINKFGAEIS